MREPEYIHRMAYYLSGKYHEFYIFADKLLYIDVFVHDMKIFDEDNLPLMSGCNIELQDFLHHCIKKCWKQGRLPEMYERLKEAFSQSPEISENYFNIENPYTNSDNNFSFTQSKMSNNIQKVLKNKATKSEKVLIDLEFLKNGTLTEEGIEVFIHFLFEKNKEDFSKFCSDNLSE